MNPLTITNYSKNAHDLTQSFMIFLSSLQKLLQLTCTFTVGSDIIHLLDSTEPDISLDLHNKSNVRRGSVQQMFYYRRGSRLDPLVSGSQSPKFPKIYVCKNIPSHNSIFSARDVICHTLSVNLKHFPQCSKLYRSHHCMHASAASAIFSFHLSNFLKQRSLYPVRLCCPFLFRNPTY